MNDRVTRAATTPPKRKPASVPPTIQASPVEYVSALRSRPVAASASEQLVEVGDPRSCTRRVPTLGVGERERGTAAAGVDL